MVKLVLELKMDKNVLTFFMILAVLFLVVILLISPPLIEVQQYSNCTCPESSSYWDDWDKTHPIFVPTLIQKCNNINYTLKKVRCESVNDCIDYPDLLGCEYDGCNWCCNNICTLMWCDNK